MTNKSSSIHAYSITDKIITTTIIKQLKQLHLPDQMHTC